MLMQLNSFAEGSGCGSASHLIQKLMSGIHFMKLGLQEEIRCGSGNDVRSGWGRIIGLVNMIFKQKIQHLISCNGAST
jgi:hypothetical protein